MWSRFVHGRWFAGGSLLGQGGVEKDVKEGFPAKVKGDWGAATKRDEECMASD